ncbi:putative flavanone 7-O-beta-glucosyltransferase [Helianthus annuus]|nr:putative flavanone 7-O-beta-glucosyltransferase [Helianthus annuus]
MNIFSMAMYNVMGQLKPHEAVGFDDETFVVPDFPRIKLMGNDFDPPLSEIDQIGPSLEFVVRAQEAMVRSHGMVVNSFYEFEPEFNDYWNRNYGPKAWLVGPFCVAKPPSLLALRGWGWSSLITHNTQSGSAMLSTIFHHSQHFLMAMGIPHHNTQQFPPTNNYPHNINTITT